MAENVISKLKKIFKIFSFTAGVLIYGGLTLFLIFIFVNVISNTVHQKQFADIKDELFKEYNYLKATLDRPDKKTKTSTDGFEDFASSEWPLMTLSLFCYGTRNLALYDPSIKKEAAAYMAEAIRRAIKPEYYHFITPYYGNPFSTDEIEDNAFYLGHILVMLSSYREISDDTSFDDLFHKFGLVFYENFKKSPTCSVNSYPGQCWSSEQTVPLRALKIHDKTFGTNYGSMLVRWKNIMTDRFVDPGLNLLVTLYDKQSGVILQGPRTITNTWTILFLHDLLPEFCEKLYVETKKTFLIRRLGLPVFKEFPGERQVSTGDTGPIIWSVSAPSTCFAMGCAGIYGDDEVFYLLNKLADCFGMAVEFGNKRKYLLGGKVGTAAAYFCRSMILTRGQNEASKPVKLQNNYLFILAITLLLLAGLMLWRLYLAIAPAVRSLKTEKE